ncbi:hypothetical protein NLU13_1075 [Sarocladium strictum]|uniref:Peptide hydrolase n=1 Tax=Sarocladium strictum TaxID=5046 RepID=A0AA39GQ96_SARSR|nr:hypothetical protein NLU13_1075 [Sarocladium strictum]
MRFSHTAAILSSLASLVSAASGLFDQSIRSDLLSLHKSLTSISSTSGNEHDVGRYLADYLVARGYKVHLQPVKPYDNTSPGKDRLNVVAVKGTDSSKRRLLLTSHIDVVPPHIPYEIDDGEVTEETMIKGRGSVDAKASVASMIIALEELLAQDRVDPDDVMLAFVVGEEVNGDGMRAFGDFLSQSQPAIRFDAAIFGEPTENKLACGHKGGLFCSLTAKGVPGHSGYPWLGKSANEVAIRALAKVLDTNLGSSEQYGNTTVNIGRFDGGVAANVIPESATIGMMVRVAIGPEKEGAVVVKERILKVLNEVDSEAFDLDCAQGYGFVGCDCNVDGFEKIVVNYGTDIPNLAGDHTRYLYGPGSILVAHGANENITVGSLEAAVSDYQKLILHALGTSKSEEL